MKGTQGNYKTGKLNQILAASSDRMKNMKMMNPRNITQITAQELNANEKSKDQISLSEEKNRFSESITKSSKKNIPLTQVDKIPFSESITMSSRNNISLTQDDKISFSDTITISSISKKFKPSRSPSPSFRNSISLTQEDNILFSDTITISSEMNISLTQDQNKKILELNDDTLFDINLNKPMNKFYCFINEKRGMEKEKTNMNKARLIYTPEWKKMNETEKKKYETLAEEDTIRFQEHIELVKRDLICVTLKKNATIFLIYLEEAHAKTLKANMDLDEAIREAEEQWKNMGLEDLRAYYVKNKEHVLMKDKLDFVVSYYSLFFRDQMSAARKQNKIVKMKECAEKWGNATDSDKEVYATKAEDEKDALKMMNLYDLAFDSKPKDPRNAFIFFLMEESAKKKLGTYPTVEGGKVWGKFTPEAKDKFNRMAQKDKLSLFVRKMEYELRQKNSNITKEEMKTRMYQKPKKWTPSYNFHLSEFGAELREKNPIINKDEVFKLVGEKWDKMTEDGKSKYVELKDKAKERYESLLKEYNEKGYYTTEARSKKIKKTKNRNNSVGKSKRAKKIKK